MVAWLSVVADITAILALVLITTVSLYCKIYDTIDRKKDRKKLREDFIKKYGNPDDIEE